MSLVIGALNIFTDLFTQGKKILLPCASGWIIYLALALVSCKASTQCIDDKGVSFECPAGSQGSLGANLTPIDSDTPQAVEIYSAVPKEPQVFTKIGSSSEFQVVTGKPQGKQLFFTWYIGKKGDDTRKPEEKIKADAEHKLYVEASSGFGSKNGTFTYLAKTEASAFDQVLIVSVSDGSVTVFHEWTLIGEVKIQVLGSTPTEVKLKSKSGEFKSFLINANNKNPLFTSRLKYKWLLNGVENTLLVQDKEFPNKASFKADVAGNSLITVELSDGTSDPVAFSWEVSIFSEPIIKEINPKVNPGEKIVITNGDKKEFYVGVEDPGGSALTYQWSLNDVEVQGTNPKFELQASGIAEDSILKVVVTNQEGQKVSQLWNTRVNYRPVFKSYSPTTDPTIYSGVDQDFSVVPFDQNKDDGISVVWTVDGIIVPPISAANANAIKLNSANYIGTHNVKVVAEDPNKLKAERNWLLNVKALPTIAGKSPSANDIILNTGSLQTFNVQIYNVNNDPLQYFWKLDNNPVASGVDSYDLVANDENLGSHILSVRIVDPGDKTLTATWNVRINSVPTITANLPTSTTLALYQNQTQAFSITASDKNSDDKLFYSWQVVPTNQVTVTGTNTASIQMNTGSYVGAVTLTANVSDGQPGSTTQKVWNITVKRPPVISASSPSNNDRVVVLQDATQVFSVTAANSANDALTYVWKVDDSIVGTNASTFSYTPTVANLGYHTLQVTITDPGNQSTSQTWLLKANAAPTVSAPSPNNASTQVQYPDQTPVYSVTIADANTSNPADTPTLTWTFDGSSLPVGSTLNGDSTALTLNLTGLFGVHNLRVLVADASHSNYLEWTINIKNPPTVSANSPSNASTVVVLENGSQVFSVTAANSAGDALTYDWKVDGTTVGTNSASFTYAPLTANLGNRTLTVTATDPGNKSVTFTWTVKVNSIPVISSPSPSNAATVVQYPDETPTYSVAIADANTASPLDTPTITWTFDGGALPVGSTLNGASTAATLNLSSLSGSHTLIVTAADSSHSTSLTWTINVKKIPSIISESPSAGSTTVIKKTNSAAFSIVTNADADLVLTRSWHIKLSGGAYAVIAGQTADSLNYDTSALAYGLYVIKAVVTDSTNRTAYKEWNLKVTDVPVFSAPAPSATKKIKYDNAAGQALTVTVLDPFNNGTAGLVYAWTLNAATVSNGILNASNNSATFYTTEDYIGSNTITLTVTTVDGLSASYSWTVEANYFSDACNNLGVGKACVVIGQTAGNRSIVTTTNQANLVRLTPNNVASDGTTSGLFISDATNHVIWFWNRSGATKNWFNQSFAAGEIRVIAGTGAPNPSYHDTSVTAGLCQSPLCYDSTTLTRAYFNDPRGMAFDAAADGGKGALWVADYGHSAIRKVTATSGVETIVGRNDTLSGENWIDSTTYNATLAGVTGKGYRCHQAQDIVLLGGSVYASCSGTSSRTIIRINTTDNKLYGVVKSAGAAIVTDGTLSNNAGATTRRPLGMAIDSRNGGQGIFVAENDTQYGCIIRYINTSGSNVSFGIYKMTTSSNTTITVNAGQVGTLMGYNVNTNTDCAHASENNSNTGIELNRPFDIEFVPIDEGGGTITGKLYILSQSFSNISLMNFSNNALVEGGAGGLNITVPAKQYYNNGGGASAIGRTMMFVETTGYTTTAGYNGYVGGVRNAANVFKRINSPSDIMVDPLNTGKLLLADKTNNILRTVDPTDSSTGKTDRLLGDYYFRTFYVDTTSAANSMIPLNPRGLAIDAKTDDIYLSTSLSLAYSRIYKINRYGLGSVIAGVNNGSASSSTVDGDQPGAVTLQGSHGIELVKSDGFPQRTSVGQTSGFSAAPYILFSDTVLTGTSPLGIIRGINMASSAVSLFGISAQDSWGTYLVAGSYVNTSSYLSGDHNTAAAGSTLYRPYSLSAYNGSFFVADYMNNCIRKISSTGILTDYLGSCRVNGTSTAGYVDGPPATATIASPGQIYVDFEGNIWFINYGNGLGTTGAYTSNTTSIRFYNNTANDLVFGGTTVPPGEVGTIIGGGDGFTTQFGDCDTGGNSNGASRPTWNSINIDYPVGLAVDYQSKTSIGGGQYKITGKVYILSAYGGAATRAYSNVKSVDLSTGAVTTILGSPGLQDPITPFTNCVINHNTTMRMGQIMGNNTTDDGQNGNSKFINASTTSSATTGPTQIRLDATGENLYVPDFGNFQVIKVKVK